MKAILFFLLVLPQLIFAQNRGLWKEGSPNTRASVRWQDVKLNRKELNSEALSVILSDIKKNGRAKFSIPYPSGGEMTFDVRPSNLLSKAVQEKNPDIQTFKGYSKNGELARINLTSAGLHAIVFSKDDTIYLDPVSYGMICM
ncbi:hypothetical protein FNH22_03500 [Fulvivirga sp. M361]|uniref:hypothetical protein n=1 Tax=Fulvivirga sp. M361 TaxID=2594266 RepID=UPI00117B2683|nr:hypothetical protein [Fulvivirga sp. M361]TRX61853.1 hypothetical protein FNH22_03500 [Fulvivirga sp. M361]